MRLVVDDLTTASPKQNDRNVYQECWLPSTDPDRPHQVVLALLPQDSNGNASAVCADLFHSYPQLECVVMCGIAGGIPNPTEPDRHVRLGDIVVADEIISYGHVRRVDGEDTLRRPTGGKSADLTRAANELRIADLTGQRPLLAVLDSTDPRFARFRRPPPASDVLYVNGQRVDHPDRTLTDHEEGSPKVHYGRIGSADILLRDEDRRDELARNHKILAVEMEASGLASAAVLRNRTWFVVRGVVDYCENTGKNDGWHLYSSLAAASYVRALLAVCHPFTTPTTEPGSIGRGSGENVLPSTSARIPAGPSPEQRRVLQAIYDSFVQHDDWPVLALVDRPLRRQGIDVVAAIRAMPAGLMPPMLGNADPQPDDRLILTLEAMALCDGAQRDVDLFLNVIRWAATVEDQFEPTGIPHERPYITSEDVSRELNLGDDPGAVKRLRLMIDVQPWGFGGGTTGPEQWSRNLERVIGRFANVRSATEHARIRRGWVAQSATGAAGTAPPVSSGAMAPAANRDAADVAGPLRASKYTPLREWLEATGQPSVRVSFDELDTILPGRLPPSARKHAAWWNNELNPASTHSQSRHGWMAAGYRVEQVDSEAGYVLFVRSRS